MSFLLTVFRTAALLLVALLASSSARAQAPAWRWAEAINQSAASEVLVQATATDAAGNVYLAGSFTDVAVFGPITLASAEAADVFVAKYDPLGRVMRRVVVPVGALEARLDVRGLCPGWYVLRGEGLRGKVMVE